MEATLKKSVALRVISQLRELTTVPIYYAPNPYGSILVLDSKMHTHFRLEWMRKHAFCFYKNCIEDIFTRLNVIFFEQPADTIINEMFTKNEYSRGSVKLKLGMSSFHRDDDYFHMNAEFGAHSLRDILISVS
jgi:hypothetical protein